ncbi:Transmembrane protein 70 mitochondrial [Fasciolopsis buskii]|uniref:Transmembrane protein 70 mitochondrial n=1 Tax=Fasciolopsis buskii TaxID=27845 RepID=A0A8E0S711_9TREM|nr:Transmembrane protein 70 mitochondrial [Fasciolopsis buski]
MQRNLANKTTEPPPEDPRGTLVYRSSNRNIVFYAKAFSLFSSSVILSFQPFIVLKLSNSGLTIVAVVCGLGFSFLTPLLLHLITRSHVHKLYYNDTTKIFTAYTRGLFLTQKQLSFTAAEVSFCEPGFSMANLAVRGTPLFISEIDFPDLVLYKHLMGFDRPMKFN